MAVHKKFLGNSYYILCSEWNLFTSEPGWRRFGLSLCHPWRVNSSTDPVQLRSNPTLPGATKLCRLGLPHYLQEQRKEIILGTGEKTADLESFLVFLWLRNWRCWLEVVSDLHRCYGHKLMLGKGKWCWFRGLEIRKRCLWRELLLSG